METNQVENLEPFHAGNTYSLFEEGKFNLNNTYHAQIYNLVKIDTRHDNIYVHPIADTAGIGKTPNNFEDTIFEKAAEDGNGNGKDFVIDKIQNGIVRSRDNMHGRIIRGLLPDSDTPCIYIRDVFSGLIRPGPNNIIDPANSSYQNYLNALDVQVAPEDAYSKVLQCDKLVFGYIRSCINDRLQQELHIPDSDDATIINVTNINFLWQKLLLFTSIALKRNFEEEEPIITNIDTTINFLKNFTFVSGENPHTPKFYWSIKANDPAFENTQKILTYYGLNVPIDQGGNPIDYSTARETCAYSILKDLPQLSYIGNKIKKPKKDKKIFLNYIRGYMNLNALNNVQRALVMMCLKFMGDSSHKEYGDIIKDALLLRGDNNTKVIYLVSERPFFARLLYSQDDVIMRPTSIVNKYYGSSINTKDCLHIDQNIIQSLGSSIVSLNDKIEQLRGQDESPLARDKLFIADLLLNSNLSETDKFELLNDPRVDVLIDRRVFELLKSPGADVLLKQQIDEIGDSIDLIKKKILAARNLITFVEKKIEMIDFLTNETLLQRVTSEIIKYVRGIFLNKGKRNTNVFNFSAIYDRYFSPGKKLDVNVIDQLINFINNINYFKDEDAYIYQLAINTPIIQNAIFNISYKGDNGNKRSVEDLTKDGTLSETIFNDLSSNKNMLNSSHYTFITTMIDLFKSILSLQEPAEAVGPAMEEGKGKKKRLSKKTKKRRKQKGGVLGLIQSEPVFPGLIPGTPRKPKGRIDITNPQLRRRSRRPPIKGVRSRPERGTNLNNKFNVENIPPTSELLLPPQGFQGLGFPSEEEAAQLAEVSPAQLAEAAPLSAEQLVELINMHPRERPTDINPLFNQIQVMQLQLIEQVDMETETEFENAEYKYKELMDRVDSEPGTEFVNAYYKYKELIRPFHIKILTELLDLHFKRDERTYHYPLFINHQIELINEGFDPIQDPDINPETIRNILDNLELNYDYFYPIINKYLAELLQRFRLELDEKELENVDIHLLVELYYNLFINPNDDIPMYDPSDFIEDMVVTGKKRKNNKKNSIKSKKRNSSTKNKKHKKKTLKTKRKKKYTK